MDMNLEKISIEQFYTKNAYRISEWLIIEQQYPPHEASFWKDDVLLELSNSVSPEKTYTEPYIWEVLTKIGIKVLCKNRKLMEKNFGLSKSEFLKMQQSLQDGNPDLFERVFLSHFEDCIQFLMRKYHIQRSDAYDISMDTMLAFYNKLIDNKLYYGNLRFLFLQMASQVFLKERQKSTTKNVKDQIGFEPVEETYETNDELVSKLEIVLTSLCSNCRQLLMSVYYEGISLKNYATKVGKTPDAVRKQKQRCAEKLRNKLREIE